VEPVHGYYHLCMPFVHSCILLLVVFLIFYIHYWWCWLFIYVWCCCQLGDNMFSIFVLTCVYVGLFSDFCVFCFVLFVCFHDWCDSSTPNQNIVRFRCGVGKSYTLLYIFL